MHMKSISAAALALSLLIASMTSAHADGRGQDWHDRVNDADHREHRDAREHHRDDDRHRHDEHRNDRDHDRGDRDYQRGYLQGRYDAGRYIRPRGYYQHSWRRGERLPAAYYANRYVVRNYNAYRLHAPPRGYHWIRVERDVVLAAVATGAIVTIVDGLFR
jgi:Ni/Co efflux regulator RcnB